MHSLSPIILLLLLGLTVNLYAQSPHGPDFKVNCAACHNSESWDIPAEAWDFEEEPKLKRSEMTGMVIDADTLKFNHFKTEFPLLGQHAAVDCRACHETLVFSEASTDCISCHTDMHRTTVGSDCARCHTTDNWLVDNITELHVENGFPLLGAHATATCTDCHTSESGLEFNRIGNDCINCHLNDFNATTNPNHPEAGFSMDCTECHQVDAFDWESEDIDHDFFPLTKGHDISDCAQCHTGGNFNDTPTDCFACHQENFENTENPDHQTADFTTDCATCHTTDPGWMPAEYLEHDQLHFPIYSGEHEGEWMQCTDCHNNPADYAEFTCISCHLNPETDEEHDGVSGYVYQDPACLACHPTGDSDNAFDHNSTNFPLTGAHIDTDCILCHADGYAGTPTQCEACHTVDFNNTTNPNHQELGLPTDCASCHTTEPGWMPATFDIHDDYYVLNGAHDIISNECATCHSGDYNNTPNTCAGCHTEDFNQTTDPDHEAAQFPIDCETCHSETAWIPSSFDHNEFFPLEGGHEIIADDCAACHHGEYDNTPNTCVGCHTGDYTTTTNPDHQELDLPMDCESCHTTDPGWMPASFDIHNDYYVLNGAHAVIANDCAACHNGDYNNTPNTCFGCHSEDYNNTSDPNHATAQFSTDCITCHTENEWVPATFDHDLEHFPIYSGAHEGEWSECIDCHTDPSNYMVVTCTNCHTNPETDDEHEGVGGYIYENTACLACHPTGDADNVFDHNTTEFPLTGAHLMTECLECHSAGYEGTSTECASCHTEDFNQTINPNHNGLGFSTDCASCHTTEPGWSPATFDNHNDYYALNGAHAAIANDCATCHNGDYNNTPNTCAGCHTEDFNQTTEPDHQAAQFPMDCATCHTETAWIPSTFDHSEFFPLEGGHEIIADDCVACHQGDYSNTPNTCAGCHTEDYTQTTNPSHQELDLPMDCESCHTTDPGWMPASFDIHNDYYVLNGAHAVIANDCAACHNGDYNNTPNTCIGCHSEDYNSTTNPNHASAQFSTDCTTCHTEDEWVPATFDHDSQYFPIYSGEHEGEWSECIDCHTNPSNYAEVNCISCHINPETDDEHEGVGGYIFENTACLACHPTGDAENVFDHNTTEFPLTGAHLMTECLECHSTGYQGTSTECASCHTEDFNQTTNPNHNGLGFSTDCATCHTTEPGWSPATFDNHNDYYALNGAHAAIANDCATCHNGDYNNTPNTCAGCHTEDFNQTTEPDHQAAQFPMDCATCHSETAWIPSSFDHNEFFPLEGGHEIIADDCVVCHQGDYSNTPNTCAGCHTEDYTQTTNPNHQELDLPMDCESCHTTVPGWMPASFAIHNDYYVLNGAHAAIANDCAACHNGDYNNTPNTCIGCHTEDFNNTTNPNHSQAGFNTDCTMCHTEDEWVPATFDHDAQYFPIYSGAHEGEWSECVDCHTNPSNYAEVSCTNCHTNPETDDEHEGVGGYIYENTACLACHPTGDAEEVFDHNTTNFPLTGVHFGVNCIECHATGYIGTPTDCASCHTEDFNQTTNPNHNSLGFSTDCASCHTTDQGWSPASFDNHNDYYALNGAHAPIANDCALCHNGDYNNTPNTCAGCHTEDYNQTTNPDHQAAQFPTDCASCHTEDSWIPANFDHDQFYPLTGAHELIADDCAACHQGDYNNTPNTCAGCHTEDYNQTNNPDHVAAQFPMDCASCHTENAWIPSNFDHNSFYPIVGAHVAIENDCNACHNGDYNNTPNTCIGCHSADYNQTTDPDHAAAQFPTDCQSCHTQDAWTPANFDHSFYPIVGAHTAIENDCNACHNGDYTNTPNTCIGCHSADYNQTTNPDHAAAQFPTDCESCHTQNAWIPSSFDHSSFYPFTGAHIPIANDCNACHQGNYTNTPNTCAGCHTEDYSQSVNPNHQALGIPMECDQCHTTDPDWMPASFDIHDNYYQLNGAHAIIADQCVTCHNGDYNNTPNTCFGCHATAYNQTTNPNHSAAQFPTDCQSCHTENTWIPSTFDHDSFYPIIGAHTAIANNCDACHNGDYNNTPNTCFGCHADDYNQTNNPDHASAGFPTDCESCHSQNAWVPATFDHDGMYFPIYSGKHDGEWNDCVDCHTTGNFSTFSCIDCHEHDDPADLADEHEDVGGYVYESNACFACHPDGED